MIKITENYLFYIKITVVASLNFALTKALIFVIIDDANAL